MKVITTGLSITKTHMIQIEDKEKGMNWFIVIVRIDGKMTNHREAINPHLFFKESPEYRNEVFHIAYKTLET